VAGELDLFLSVSRNDVEVDVHDGLPRGFTVVLEDVESVAGKCLFQVVGDFLHTGDECGKRLVGSIQKAAAVFLGDNKGMSLGEGVDVQIGEHKLVFIDLE